MIPARHNNKSNKTEGYKGTRVGRKAGFFSGLASALSLCLSFFFGEVKKTMFPHIGLLHR